ncbi:hypothetical protein [Paenibacillus sp. RC21]|uniref:hypothetical protein n=1 Tax=Paenibacillus sp. RC21 TaxID=3156312 RepID=UPI003836C27F
MSKSLIEYVISIDEQEDLHLVRLMILIHILIGKKSTALLEISTLSKLDFLLRYPAALERALAHLPNNKTIQLSEAEKNNIETKMILFRYSPWSSTFRRLLVILESKCLIKWKLNGKKIEFSMTDKGTKIVLELSGQDIFGEMIRQSKLIKTNIVKLSASKLNELMNIAVTEAAINF